MFPEQRHYDSNGNQKADFVDEELNSVDNMPSIIQMVFVNTDCDCIIASQNRGYNVSTLDCKQAEDYDVNNTQSAFALFLLLFSHFVCGE